jgi:PAS domain S-box-containing protein
MQSESQLQGRLGSATDPARLAGTPSLALTGQHTVPFADRAAPRRATGSFFAELGDDPAADDSESASRAMLREALDSLVTLIERVAGRGMRGSVLLLDDDGITLRHGGAPNLPIEYCRLIDGLCIGPIAGSCGTAAFRKERVIVRDITTDPLWEPYRNLVAPFGLVACWSTPIIDSGGTVLGTFAMYYDEPKEPTPDDIQLTETATLLAKNVIKRARATTKLRARTDAAERLAVALQESEARFRMMAETIPVQVWTTAPDGMLDFVTQRTADTFGRPVDELLRSGWIDMVHPDDVEPTLARWRASLDSGAPYEVQFRLRTRAGEYRWFLARAQPLMGEDGFVAKWFGCNTDIEEYKRLQAALDTALEDAREANAGKARFLAMMSHELRTPLNAIGGYTQLMLDGIPAPPSKEHRDFLDRIARSQRHLLGLIETVLMHAKLEAGKTTYAIEAVRAGEVLTAIDSLTAPQRAAKQLAYDCTGCDRMLEVRADREKLTQILLNVIGNAVKFTPEHGRITVRTAMLDTGAAEFEISDSGVGMSPDQAARVFEPYTQFESSLSGQSRGTGLGMPISRDLARGMGGDLTVESTLGAGTTFRLVLPVA